jgi:hypothetical protein
VVVWQFFKYFILAKIFQIKIMTAIEKEMWQRYQENFEKSNKPIIHVPYLVSKNTRPDKKLVEKTFFFIKAMVIVTSFLLIT